VTLKPNNDLLKTVIEVDATNVKKPDPCSDDVDQKKQLECNFDHYKIRYGLGDNPEEYYEKTGKFNNPPDDCTAYSSV
jgi:hypothetical protein